MRELKATILVAALLLAGLVASQVGSIGGWLNPVMGPLTLFDPRPDPPPQHRTAWHGRAAKLRDCSYSHTEWFLGDRGGAHVPVRMQYLDPPTLRGRGVLEWTGIQVWLAEDDVRRRSFADVYHRCAIRLFGRAFHFPWLTRTAFYDGAVQ